MARLMERMLFWIQALSFHVGHRLAGYFFGFLNLKFSSLVKSGNATCLCLVL